MINPGELDERLPQAVQEWREALCAWAKDGYDQLMKDAEAEARYQALSRREDL